MNILYADIKVKLERDSYFKILKINRVYNLIEGFYRFSLYFNKIKRIGKNLLEKKIILI
jgi:hypothetical protein